jgi:methylated-DNA-[protein]-cysteine S-methyltransferase
MTGFALFDTAIGRCGIAWGEHGVVGVQLPEATDARTRARLSGEQAPPPPHIQRIVNDIVRLLDGEPVDLSTVELDMAGVPEFHRQVYDVARTIPAGSTLSYGEIAAEVGDRGLARAVGQALGRNPFPIIVPCHRVLAAGGKPGGFSAGGGVATKQRMLAIEGAIPPTLF